MSKSAVCAPHRAGVSKMRSNEIERVGLPGRKVVRIVSPAGGRFKIETLVYFEK